MMFNKGCKHWWRYEHILIENGVTYRVKKCFYCGERRKIAIIP